MGAILGDLIQLVDNQSYLGQQVLNVYYYRVTSITPLADGYLESMNSFWETNVLSPILVIQTAGLAHNSREWRNLTNGIDLFTEATVIYGEATGGAEELPSYLSWGFMLQRESLATRNGYKRFAGVPEGFITGNLPNSGALPSLDDVSAALPLDIMAGIATIAEPVIVKRPIVPPVEEYIYSSIGSAPFRSLGTQNTRKAGRGV